jgi:hypothetical protein
MSNSSVRIGFAKQIMPILRILHYNGSLVTWTVVNLTTTKFKRPIFSMSHFAFTYTANMYILMILWLLLVACTILLYNRIHTEGWKPRAPWKFLNKELSSLYNFGSDCRENTASSISSVISLFSCMSVCMYVFPNVARQLLCKHVPAAMYTHTMWNVTSAINYYSETSGILKNIPVLVPILEFASFSFSVRSHFEV